MTIEVIEVNAFGHGYCVVHQDDGTSFGQHFRNLPVDDAPAFDAALADHVDQAVLRNTPVVAKTIDAQVLSRIGVKKATQVKIA